MTKTISTNSLNFTNLYFLSYFPYLSVHHKYLHNNTGMNGSLHLQIIIYIVLKDKLKQTSCQVHSGRQRLGAVPRASGINRYEDDLIAYIKLFKKKET